MEDLAHGPLKSTASSPKPGREGLLHLLDDRTVTVLPFSAWEKIDSEEKTRGSIKDKPREKLCSWEELMKVGFEWFNYTLLTSWFLWNVEVYSF